MDPAHWIVPAALAFGLLVGVGVSVAIMAAHRRGRSAVAVVTAVVPDGVEEVIDSLESAGVVIDSSNNVLSASTAALAFGLVWNQALAHPEIIALVNQVRRDGIPVNRELHLTRSLFGEAQLHVNVRVARLGTRFVLLLAEDRTESFRLDEVRRDFVANISHELKTPVGALSLLAETLVDEADPQISRRLAERMVNESLRLANTIDDLLVLSRIEAEDAPEREPVFIESVIRESLGRIRPAAEQAGISIAGPTDDVRAAVMGDRRQLVSALSNLLDNAVKYSDAGSAIDIEVVIDAKAVDLTVADHGIGIPARDHERVFERFYRVDLARSRQTGGTGLGLSIVRHVVENHAGEVRLESRLGEGSRLTLRLPLLAAGPVALAAADDDDLEHPERDAG